MFHPVRRSILVVLVDSACVCATCNFSAEYWWPVSSQIDTIGFSGKSRKCGWNQQLEILVDPSMPVISGHLMSLLWVKLISHYLWFSTPIIYWFYRCLVLSLAMTGHMLLVASTNCHQVAHWKSPNRRHLIGSTWQSRAREPQVDALMLGQVLEYRHFNVGTPSYKY